MNIIVLAVIFVLAFVCVILALIPFLKKQLKEEIQSSQEQFLQLARQQFELDQARATSELEKRKQAIEGNVQGLKEQLDQYQRLLREFERDRTQKYGNLENELKNASLATGKLQEATTRLNNILGNVKLRGQWGERVVEDIIEKCGLIENVNYLKQKKMENSPNRPDYTFILPNQHRVNMDVKFALDNYINMVNAQTPPEREQYKKEFLKNVDDRIKEIKDRGYINPQENTLDFVLLFIPNEQVFGFIQENVPGLMDRALAEKVVICSPFTLYAMLSVIRQAYENFRYEKDMKKIIDLIEQFTKTYVLFKDRFESIGSSLEKLQVQYQDVKDKSFKNLDTKINKIEDYKKGTKVSFDAASPNIIEIAQDVLDDNPVAQ
ncbi:MAG: hypothetical protein A2787_07850 [Omnitrophica WOR_2 bacterium RIFCSPHIGHO2_01_FULL_48_9]|nr:MAG: hypothetical protein A3D10_03805 [Omnitrophica WOR_2 bacterium RIFCSPHIGHO2_02_FULL_48_11]OGX33759.1 MAG: hypothetical protein A2787_07850 [Omnitrophica WOR_2 bacterium RIFCSPHIGHO2_01_FULL_48_9]